MSDSPKSNYNNVPPAFPKLPEQDHFNQQNVPLPKQDNPVRNVPDEPKSDKVSGGLRK